MDDDVLHRACPSVLDSLWHHTGLFTPSEDPSLFQSLEFDLPELKSPTGKDLQPDLSIPDLFTPHGAEQTRLEGFDDDSASLGSVLTVPDTAIGAQGPDVWAFDFDFDQLETASGWHSWESFQGRTETTSERPCFLAEAGPQSFNAALARSGLHGAVTSVLPQDVLLRALSHLVVGRGSTIFHWNDANQLFEQSLGDVPGSGYSLECYNNFTADMMACGTTFRKLRTYSSKVANRTTCTAVVALRDSVATILDGLERYIATGVRNVVSMLQFQGLVERPSRLLGMLDQFVVFVADHTTDEEIISTLSDEVTQALSIDNTFAEIVQVLLARVSGPWLERLHAEVSMRPAFVCDGHSTGSAEENGLPGSDALPPFISAEDRRLISNTKATLQILRSKSSDGAVSVAGFGESRTLQVAEPALPAILVDNAHSAHIIQDGGSSGSEFLSWSDSELQGAYFAATGQQMSQPVKLGRRESLEFTAVSILEEHDAKIEPPPSLRWSVGEPIDLLRDVRPHLRAHALHTDRILFQLLFNEMGLVSHLDSIRQYFLFGNGDFASRMSTTLFCENIQSAQRQRGSVPNGQAMGLRLGTQEGQRWPPTSSEVQLSLTDILSDTFRPQSQGQEPPGGLSFSIREMSENEIEKVTDPQSIHALDFLKLQYTSPGPLSAILTPSAMSAYDEAFRLLIKLLRLTHVTTRLKESICMRKGIGQTADSGLYLRRQFVSEAHHCILVLSSHFLESAIEEPCSKLMTSMADAERAASGMGSEGVVEAREPVGVEQLSRVHHMCVDTIRSRLFLRRKQAKIYEGLCNVMTSILKGAALLDDEHSTGLQESFDVFRRSVKGLLSVLRQSVEHSRKAISGDTSAEEDLDVTKFLLARLNWNGFYGDGDES
ncbi:Spc98 family-domain-containing protein [Neohortaea acidophila]|uniref:Spindle pole body component n=1 Tax=Neohortaea acidophila TaxID=245834 RepID=A0A6A6PIQ1_9PEZI|nr:Spc98 family-domain-containing protein [Neohortaea acidophila]KAF2479795.1 Spc98 family-domain-containing protein [Neohortaea acidophila]